MEMIAAFRFKKAETRFSKSKPYLMEMEKLLANLSAASADLSHPLFESREVKTKALVVFTADKGLCGAYNTNLIKQANLWLKQNQGYKTYLVPIGKVGNEFFRKKQIPILESYPEKSQLNFAIAKGIAVSMKEAYLSGKIDKIDLLYASYRTGGTGKIQSLPFLDLGYLAKAHEKKNTIVDYIYEPDLAGVFGVLLERYLEGKIYLATLESLTSEYVARMVAMKQATENGEEVLDSLKLLRNKTRQATITRELSEIVSGASILV